MARHVGTARAAALSLLPLVALIHTTSGRRIVLLGPQYLGAEAGIQWNDASSDCNSRLVVNSVERKLKYCAYYEDMNGIEDNPPMTGVPMDCYTGCTWNSARGACDFQSNDAIGEYRGFNGGGCARRTDSSRLQCHLPQEEDCRSKLLMVPNASGVQQTVQTIRGADDPVQPTRLSVRFNPGAYYIGFGTSSDTCVATNDCDPAIAPCGGSGPCIKVVNVTDTRPPVITPLIFCHTPNANGAVGTERCEDAASVHITVQFNSSVRDSGATAVDLVDGYMQMMQDTYGNDVLCPTQDDATDYDPRKVCGNGSPVCGFQRKTCRFADTPSRDLDTRNPGSQTLFYIAVDRVGNYAFSRRYITVLAAPTVAPTTRHPTSAPTRRPTRTPTKHPTSTPTSNPTTASPTAAPSAPPTASPTTSAPTTASPSVPPTASPITLVPTTSVPTRTPTTETPMTETRPQPSGNDGGGDGDSGIIIGVAMSAIILVLVIVVACQRAKVTALRLQHPANPATNPTSPSPASVNSTSNSSAYASINYDEVQQPRNGNQIGVMTANPLYQSPALRPNKMYESSAVTTA